MMIQNNSFFHISKGGNKRAQRPLTAGMYTVRKLGRQAMLQFAALTSLVLVWLMWFIKQKLEVIASTQV